MIPMGVKELRESFNQVAAPTATCVKALMENAPDGYQKLYFSGSYANGEGFVIESPPIYRNTDLVIASRETAQALLNRKRATP
jgi:hypothetical protein